MSVEHQHDRGVLDTNAVIGLPRMADAGMLPAEPTITAITLAELSVGPLVAPDAAERAGLQAHLQQAEADFDPLPFDDAAARVFGQVASDLRASGRKRAARAYDALIAATAISNGLPLYTANPADFEGITDLEIVVLPVSGAASK
ncbi:type II toxin-antitoxin system VapC family toxin [Candidatus Poriferisodalis sp.]|uniref:type II toxin-antitoxin system VapC family toxin n=1 Tax=Candidatus Poriferisodalis sp. TaxID=3101277 RepID=UPI003B025CA5